MASTESQNAQAPPASDPDPLAEIEISVLKELKVLRDQQALVEKRLEDLEALRGSTNPLVFDRVLADYRDQVTALDERAEPLRRAVRTEFVKLQRLIDRLHRDEEASQLTREELELRHQVGEFGKEEFEARRSEIAQQAERTAKRAERAGKLRAHFVAAFRSEEELTSGERAETPKAAPADHGQPAGLNQPPEGGGTLIISATELGATMMVEPARLLLHGDGGEPEIYPLRLDVTTLGRDSQSHIRIRSKAVSRRHAEIRLDAAGFALHDLESENGTFVNGDRVSSVVLKHGDTIRFGDIEYVFELT